jgi:hypothetical protein
MVVALVAPLDGWAGRLFKWVDEAGVIHYGDRIPADESRKQHAVLDDRGVVRKRIRAAKSPKEIAAERRRLALEKEREQAEQERAFRDKILLDTFSTERDLLLTRDDRLATVDSMIKLIEKSMAKPQQELGDLKEKIAAFENTHEPVPPVLAAQYESLARQLRKKSGTLQARHEERAELEARFEQDLRRFRQLQEMRGAGF